MVLGEDCPVLKDASPDGQTESHCILTPSWARHSTSSSGEEKEDPCTKNNDKEDDDHDDVYRVFEEFDFSQLPDTDECLYPPGESSLHQCRQPPGSPDILTFFKACCSNKPIIVKIMIRHGVTEDEVREVDKNNRTGLIMACYHGYVDVVIALTKCPYVDVNWQDSEGNTALMVAAQAGHTVITTYLLNYFAGLDIERRNCHGFTALMKAAMQGQTTCVRAIMMSGGDVESRDRGRKLTALEWALITGHYETAWLMMRLTARPCAERSCLSCMEWPALHGLAGHSADPTSCWKKLLACVCARLGLGQGAKPRQQGALDYMVRMTTVLASPLVLANACCPVIPPSVGALHPGVLHGWGLPPHPIPNAPGRPAPPPDAGLTAAAALCRSLLHMVVRSSVHPTAPVPRLQLCQATQSTHTPESWECRDSRDQRHLQVPSWKCNALGDGRW